MIIFVRTAHKEMHLEVNVHTETSTAVIYLAAYSVQAMLQGKYGKYSSNVLQYKSEVLSLSISILLLLHYDKYCTF